ncbi:MAG: hypothetical protein ACT4P9_09040 [Betaproteobacteria bacterium]
MLGVSGCGGVHWEKPGASSTDVANELEACRKEARAKYGSATAPMPGPSDPRFGPMDPSQADVRMQEGQAIGSCMRAKGYGLVPDK